MTSAPTTGTNQDRKRSGPDLIRAMLPRLPEGPGVYRMADVAGQVLYVGKARNLRRRVANYTKLGGHNQRIARMLADTTSLEIITTPSESEALLLEANLIKRLKPRYNVILRDDKSYPYILVRGDHDFPQIIKYRGALNKKGDYFGPFASAGAVSRTLNTLQRAFLLRSCSDSVFDSRSRPCLLYQIKRCSAPCVGYIDKDGYAALVAQAGDFLSGRSAAVRADLTQGMEEAAQTLDFERAARLRDRIKALAQIHAQQDIASTAIGEADAIAVHCEGGLSCVQVFFFRNGQNWGNRAYFPRHDRDHDKAEILEAFIAQFYDDKPVPRQILLSHDIAGRQLLAQALSTRSGRRVTLAVPERGEKRAVVLHGLDNAREALARRLAESQSQRRLLEAVAEMFGLAATPSRIEVFDNSHIQGANALGAMIVAGPDGFEKNQYRKFNIKSTTLTPGDDYAMMREVLGRRLSRLALDDDPQAETPRPDLLLIDGGRGQLTAAQSVLADLGLSDIPVVAIAKGPERDAGRERFFMNGRESFVLEPKSPVLYYLQRLRDEAHRFAIGGHRTKRTRDIRRSPLDEIAGIGPARKRALLHHFGSARGVGRASLADLEKVEGISTAMARRIHDFFRNEA